MAMRYLLIILLSTAPITSYSWECGSKWNNEGNIVFSGVVVNIKPILESNVLHGREITFKSTSESGVTYIVTTGLFGASPGYPFLCGSKYLVHATNTNGRTVTNACHKIKALDGSPEYDVLENVILIGNEGESLRKRYLQKISECHENK